MQKLDEHLLRELRLRLEKDKESLTKRLAELASQDPFSNKDRLNDNASDDTEAYELSGHERLTALMDELKKDVSDIDLALARMNNGTYGICTKCGKLIEEERLRILPTTTVSIACENT